MSEPVTRIEKYLAYAAGEWNGVIPAPVTRIEQYLYDLCINGGGGGGTTDYNALHNKPKINGQELKGNKTSADLHLLDEDSDLTDEQMINLLRIITG